METRPLLIGHRGARAAKSVPENTLEAFDFALAHGCDGFEFDVRLSADGRAVVCHNATVRGLEVAQCSAQQLGLPYLREVLQRYQASAFLDIELKVSGLEGITLDLQRQLPPARGYVISSFLPEVVNTIHGMDATIPLGLICETRDQFGQWDKLPIEYVIPQFKLASQSAIQQIHKAGKKVLVWTVNSAADIKRFAECGVDGIVSDDPERLAAAMGRGPRS
jgi:glycerophosphoryl diester phosphodiesterase